jgi:hypothetical protein
VLSAARENRGKCLAYTGPARDNYSEPRRRTGTSSSVNSG